MYLCVQLTQLTKLTNYVVNYERLGAESAVWIGHFPMEMVRDKYKVEREENNADYNGNNNNNNNRRKN